MSFKDEITPKLFDYSKSPASLLSNFSSFFKPVQEVSTANRLSTKKLSQSFSPVLCNILRNSLQELSKKSSTKYQDYLIQLSSQSLDYLSKLSSHSPEETKEFYNFSYSFALKLNELCKYEDCLRTCRSISKSLEQSDFITIRVNFYLLLSSSLLSQGNTNIKTLEQVYDLLAIKTRNLLFEHKKSFDGHGLNKVYQNLFKSLMKTGKMLDTLAAGDVNLHIQALKIRTISLDFFSKTKPLIISDYIAFAYSSVLGCFKWAESLKNKSLYSSCVSSIDDSLGPVQLSADLDKNLRSMIELKALNLNKIEKFSKVKETLTSLVTGSEDLLGMLLDLKCFLEIVKAQFLGKLEIITDLEVLHLKVHHLFEVKLTSPSVIKSGELAEIKEQAPKVMVSFENLQKFIATVHSPNSVKSGLVVPVSTLKMMVELGRFYLKMIRFLEKLELTANVDLGLFYYSMVLNFSLLYINTKDSEVLSQLLGYCSQFPVKQSTRFLNNVYNLLLNLVQTGERETAMKIALVLIENTQFLHENLIHLLELLSKYTGDDLSSLKFTRKTLSALFFRLNDNEKTTNLGLKLVEITVNVQCKAIKLGDPVFVFEQVSADWAGKVLEKEIDVLVKRVLFDGDPDLILFERIQNISRVLLFKFYKPFSVAQMDMLIKYFEVLGTLSPNVQEEKVVNEIFSVVSSEKNTSFKEKLLKIIKFFYKHHKRPVLVLWKCLVNLELIKEAEQADTSTWITRESLKIYIKIVKNLEKMVDLYSENLKIIIKKDLTIKKLENSPSLFTDSDIKTLNLSSEICHLYSLHSLEYSFLVFLEELVSDPTQKDCLEVRKKLCLYHLGHEKQVFFSLPIEEAKPSEDFFTHSWKLCLYSEFLFYSGKLDKSQSLLSSLLKSLTPNHLEFKRGQLLKSYILWVLSLVSLIQGNYCGSLSLCNEGRSLLKLQSITSFCIHNLTVFNSISDCFTKQQIIYPNTSWSFQSLSIVLTQQLAEIYIRLSMTVNSSILFAQNLKLAKLLASPSLFLFSSSKTCILHRQTSIGITQENIKESIFVTIQPVEFAEGVFSNVFEVLLMECERFKERKIVEVLDTADVDLFSKVVDKESLCYALVTLGDILQTPFYYRMIDLMAAEQNYYRLARYLINYSSSTAKFAVLRSLIYRKLALLNYKQYPKKFPVEDLENSLFQVSCCKNFIRSECCGNKVSPLLQEELCFSTLALCSFLLDQNENIHLYLSYILSSPYLSNPSILNQTHYFSGLSNSLDNRKRTFHLLSSIGTSYNTQAFLPCFSDSDEMFSSLSSLPEGQVLIGLSIGRNPSKHGSLICRVECQKEPICSLSNNCHCTGSQNLSDFLEEFNKIMQEAGKTSSQSEKVIQVNSGQWWETRERLDEKLKKLLESMQDKYFGILASLFVGRIQDPSIDQMIYMTAKDLFPDTTCACGEPWTFQLLYCLFTAYLCGQFTLEAFQSQLTGSVFEKYQDEIMKKAKTLKRLCSSKVLDQFPVTLLISGHLLHFPWESMKIFNNTYVTRSLSLRLLLQSLPSPRLQYKSCFYILNPSNDLESTQKTFSGFFSSHSNWTGLSREPPSEDQFKEVLSKKDLVIYCGHSSGEQYLRSEKIKEIRVKSATFLFGCSSGLLRSQGFFEPQGVAVQYSIARCPGLLANLWDVTDKDIDRFALEMMRKIELGSSVGIAISAARNACKLKFLVGAAPVWYGVPLEFNLN